MFTSFDKALVGVVMGLLFILNSVFHVNFGFTQEQVAAVLGVLTPVLIYIWPNLKTVITPPSA